MQPKQQLLGCAMGLRQQYNQQLIDQAVMCITEPPPPSRNYNLSYLTDMFALSVMYHVEGTAYLSKRVTDAKAFCMRLLLMCHEFSPDEWNKIRLPGAVAVDIGMMGSNVSPIDSNRSSPLAHRYTGPVTHSRRQRE